MNILLVSPRTDIAYKAFNINLPPLGLMYLAGSLVKAGHRVHIFDENAEPARKRIDFAPYDLVGVGPSTCCYNRAAGIARGAKRAGKTVVMGGYHVSFEDEEALRSGCADVVVRGEAEHVLVQVAGALESGRPLSGIPAVTYREGERLVRQPGAGLIEDLDGLPYPARGLIDHRNYSSVLEGKKVTPMITSRGCTHNCTFCSVARFNGGKWRARTPEQVLREIQDILSNGWAEAIIFNDDNFTANPRRVDAICDGMVKNGLKFPWWCMSRADTILRNKDMVRKMAKTGCAVMFLGLESGAEEVLTALGKQATTDIARQAIAFLNGLGIKAFGSFMIGAPDETEKDMLRTIDFSRELKLNFAQFSILTPMPGTPLYDEVRDKITEKNWDRYDGLHNVFTLNHVAKEKVEKLVYRAYWLFFRQPRVVFLLARSLTLTTGLQLLSALGGFIVRHIKKIV